MRRYYVKYREALENPDDGDSAALDGATIG